MTAPSLLLEPASYWSHRTWADRLDECARTLCAHGYLTDIEWRRIQNRIALDKTAAREKAVSPPPRAVEAARKSLSDTESQWPETPLPDCQLPDGACS